MKKGLLAAILIVFVMMAFKPFQDDDPCKSDKIYYSLEEALKNPEEVKVLDLAMQDPKLIELPIEIGQFVNLECLDVSFNRISHLPDELKNLQQLRSLNLSGNRYLSTFPEILLELPQLQTLDLTGIPEWSKEKCDAAKAALPTTTVLTDN